MQLFHKKFVICKDTSQKKQNITAFLKLTIPSMFLKTLVKKVKSLKDGLTTVTDILHCDMISLIALAQRIMQTGDSNTIISLIRDT